MVTENDHRRPETTIEVLESLQPAFRKDGIVTAGNASGMVDGAAAVVVTHAKIAKERGWKPLGRSSVGRRRACRRKLWALVRCRRFRKRWPSRV